jgi:hypothetical protein
MRIEYYAGGRKHRLTSQASQPPEFDAATRARSIAAVDIELQASRMTASAESTSTRHRPDRGGHRISPRAAPVRTARLGVQILGHRCRGRRQRKQIVFGVSRG